MTPHRGPTPWPRRAAAAGGGGALCLVLVLAGARPSWAQLWTREALGRVVVHELVKEPAAPGPGAPAPSGAREAGRSLTPYTGYIHAAARRYGLSADLLDAVIAEESGYDPRAVSRAGAMGLMQLMPETARELEVSNPFDPRANIEGGARYLRRLLDTYGQDLTLALAAYHAGPARVDRKGGVPDISETRAYVANIRRRLRGTNVVYAPAVLRATSPAGPAASAPQAGRVRVVYGVRDGEAGPASTSWRIHKVPGEPAPEPPSPAGRAD